MEVLSGRSENVPRFEELKNQIYPATLRLSADGVLGLSNLFDRQAARGQRAQQLVLMEILRTHAAL
jgi:hypothetical protein